MKKVLMVGVAAAVIIGFTPITTNAAGFYIQEQSVKGLGTAFAGSATSIDDASTIYFNPAGMTKLDGRQVNAGVHVLIPNADLDDTGSDAPLALPNGVDTGNPYDPTPIPNLYIASPFDFHGTEFWAGIGVSAPFGLASDYGTDSFVRFDSTETALTTINIQPSIATQVTDWLSIGGGIDVQYADAELKSRAFAGAEGDSTLQGDDISVGYNIGLQLYPADSTEIGLHYRSAINHELEGRIYTVGTGADFNIAGSAALNLPDITTAGIAHDVTDDLRIMGQFTWFGWSNFDEIRARNSAGATISNVQQNYNDTFAIAIGAEYDLNDQWTLRAGYQFDETPTDDNFRTSRTPDGDRNWFSGGASYKLRDNLELDFAATYIDIGDEEINVTRNAGLATVSADTEGYVGIVAAGINWKF